MNDFANDILFSLNAQLIHSRGMLETLKKNCISKTVLHRHEELGKIQAIESAIKSIKTYAKAYKIKLENE